MSRHYSFIFITYNEEIHLPASLAAIAGLNAPIFVLDSGSTDATLSIAEQYGATVVQNPFVNHPQQWHHALTVFKVETPWVICLDADQQVTAELFELLQNFDPIAYQDVDGIYFNRKNHFKGRWLKHGGYFPFYLLKMFRSGIGYSDLNENMDHRFIVPGKTSIWKKGFLREENLKENDINFWLQKHLRYSDLVAQEEVDRMNDLREQTVTARFWGTPDERTAWLKRLWWKMPRYSRPVFYFGYRFFIKLGFLDGRTGIIFHFLQGFWFRLIVDIKIDELLKKARTDEQQTK